MAQIFRPEDNDRFKQGMVLFIVTLGLIIWAIHSLVRSDYVSGVDEVVLQPVQFSHQHHVSGLGMDCRYCHTTVERSGSAGMPSTHTCMTCHSQIWAQSPMLAPVRESFRLGQPMVWNRVTKVPDFVYFHHGIHIQKGIECRTCHGKVEEMPLMRKVHSFTMEWCLNCHRNPPTVAKNSQLTNCTVCHR